MRDRDRALAYVTEFRIGVGRLGTEASTVALATEFAAVRLEERRAIAEWLQTEAPRCLLPAVQTALAAYADAISRGEHLEGL